MKRGIWTKWIIGAAFLLLIVAAGCILYYQHTTAPYKAEAEKTDKLLEKWKADKATPPTPAEAESTQAPTAEKPTITIGEERTETNTDKSTEPVTIATPEQDNTEEVKVSPHGFGHYPEVPEDYPIEVNWSSYEDDPPIFELMARVQIKLWKQGHRTEGIGEEGGLLYPISRGIVYIRWSDNGKYISRVSRTSEGRSV